MAQCTATHNDLENVRKIASITKEDIKIFL